MGKKSFTLLAIGIAFFVGVLFGGIQDRHVPSLAEAGGVASCFDIKELRVIYNEPLDHMEGVCRLELEAPMGYFAVDRKGQRLPFHPYVLIKKK